MTTNAPDAIEVSALDPAHSVVVEACAGSGKTWLLVSRILRLLLDGVAPGEILAITFTRQAAQEMAERLHQWLRILATADDAGVRAFLAGRALPAAGLGTAVARARALYEQVLTAQPPLTISTFHSWFMQLLRSAPLEAAAIGSASLIERTAALRKETWALFAEDCRRDPHSGVTQALDFLFSRYGLQSTRELLENFVEHRADWWAYAGRGEGAVGRALARQAAQLDVSPQDDAVEALLADAAVVSEVRELIGLIEGFASDDSLERGWARDIATALDADDCEQAFGALRRALFTDRNELRVRKPTKKRGQRLGAPGQSRYLELCQRLALRTAEIVQARADQASYHANAAGLTAGVALLERYQALKRDRQVIDFADVEWLAFELLRSPEHAVTMHFKLDSRYRHILLDEFQDTNPLQWLALEAWFAAAAQAHSAPGVFLVGDPKQAIFRFRRADARLFDAARSWLVAEHAAAVHACNQSRRCAQPILDVVNALFRAEPAFAPFHTHDAHQGDLPGRVEVLPLACAAVSPAPIAAAGLRDPLGSPRAIDEDTRREREAQMLVERLRAIVGRCAIADEHHPQRARRARYGDVMLLVRRRTHLQVYERALRHAGMPFVTSRQGGLLDTLEAEDLMALLEFLISPFDDLKLAHALRSPVFGASDDDLAGIAQAAGESWWERLDAMSAETAQPRLARAHELLTRWLDWADRLPVHDMLDRIYFEGDVLRRYEAAVPPPMRAAVAANLDAFIQRALDVDSGRYPSLPRFLAELRDMLDVPPEEAPDEGDAAAGADAIRILTVHGAKGLESPIVWLLDTAASRPLERGFDVLVRWEPGDSGPSELSLLTRSAERSRTQRRQLEEEAHHAEREELNLLYVAMTRARQMLFASGCESRSARGSWYARLRAAAQAAAGRVDLPADEIAVHGGDPLEMPIASPQAGAGDDANGARAGGHSTPQGAAGGQLELDFAAAMPVPDLAAAVLSVGRRLDMLSSPGLRYGATFHSVMQHVSAGEELEPAALAHRLGMPLSRLEPMWAQAQRLMASADLVHFFHPQRFERALNEWPIVTAAGELRRIDRLVEFADEVWVLDYKTGGRGLVTAALETEYRAQVAAYCTALRRVFAPKPVRGLLLFADGSSIEVDAA